MLIDVGRQDTCILQEITVFHSILYAFDNFSAGSLLKI